MTRLATVLRRHKLPRRDRLWLGVESTFAVSTGPAEMPTVESVRAVIRELATIDPGNRFVRRVDADRGVRPRVRSSRRERFLSALVTGFDDGPAAVGEPDRDPGPLLGRLGEICEEGLGDLPVRILVGRRCSIFVFSHLTGDYSCLTFWTGVLRHALAGSRPTDLVESGTRYPLPRAVADTYGRRPALLTGLAASMRARREVPVPAVRMRFLGDDRPGLDEPALVEAAAGLPPIAFGVDGAAGGADSAAGVGRLAQRSKPGYLAMLREWRDAHVPGVSVNSVLFAATLAASDLVGLPRDDDGVHLPCDLRRYLRDDAPRFGNFVERLTMWPDDPTSPASLGAQLRRATEVGQPLARHVVQIAKTWRPRSRSLDAAPPSAPDTRPWLVSWGRVPGLEGLRWLAPADGRYFVNARSGGAGEGISFVYVELAGTLHVRAQFDERRYDTALVRQALDLLCTDPIGVLDSHSGGRTDPARTAPPRA